MKRMTALVCWCGVAMSGGGALGVNHAVIVGVDYGRAGQMWAPDANNVAAALGGQAANWNAANIIVLSGNGGGVVTAAGILGAIGAKAAAAAAGDGFLFYYSGHGSFFDDVLDRERVMGDLINPGRARNACDETLFVSGGAAGSIGDDALRTAMNAFNANVNKLAFLDSCFSGGFWNGTDAGDLDLVVNQSLIAAADENSTAPGSSNITNNWINWMGTNAFNLQAMNAAALTGMFNVIKPGAVNNPQQKRPPGFPEQYDPIFDSFPGAPNHPANAEIWTNTTIPTPGSIALLSVGAMIVGRRRRM